MIGDLHNLGVVLCASLVRDAVGEIPGRQRRRDSQIRRLGEIALVGRQRDAEVPSVGNAFLPRHRQVLAGSERRDGPRGGSRATGAGLQAAVVLDVAGHWAGQPDVGFRNSSKAEPGQADGHREHLAHDDSFQ